MLKLEMIVEVHQFKRQWFKAAAIQENIICKDSSL